MHGVEDFDAACFSIHASEALVMDPQQRLMLEVCCIIPCNGSATFAQFLKLQGYPTTLTLAVARVDGTHACLTSSSLALMLCNCNAGLTAGVAALAG